MILERFRIIFVLLPVSLMAGCAMLPSWGKKQSPSVPIVNAPGPAAQASVAGASSAGSTAHAPGFASPNVSFASPKLVEVPVGGLIRPPSGMSVEQAISEITSRSVLLLGSPYRLGGSSPLEGFDCSGLVTHVMQDAFSLKFPRTAEEQAAVGISVPKGDLKPGDLVFFNTTGRPNSHVGVYLGQSRFVHAPTSRGVVRIESLAQSYWARRFEQARRLIAQN